MEGKHRLRDTGVGERITLKGILTK